MKNQLLDTESLKKIVPVSVSHLYKMMAESSFPRPIGPVGGKNLWLASDIDRWLEDQSTYCQPADVA